MIGKMKRILLLVFAFFLISVLSIISADFVNETDEYGNIIIIDDSGKTLATIPPGYTYEIEDDKFIFTNEDAEGLFPLEFKDYKISLEKGSEIVFSMENGNYILNLTGEGNINILFGGEINNVKDAVIKIDEVNNVVYADFISTEKEEYVFRYGEQEYIFKVEEGGRVHFNPKEGKITTESAEVTLNNIVFGSSGKIDFKLDDLGYLEDAHFDGKGYLSLDDGVTEIVFDKSLDFYSYKKRCEDSLISCIQVLRRQRIKDSKKVLTNELDIFVSDGNLIEIVSEDGIYDDISLKRKNNKLDDGDVFLSLIKGDGDIFSVTFDDNGRPLIKDPVNLTTAFHFTGLDDDGNVHLYHLVKGEEIVCSECKTLGYAKKLILDDCLKLYMYSGGDKGSRVNLFEWFDESDICYQSYMFRNREKEQSENKIRMITGHHFGWTNLFFSDHQGALRLSDLPISSTTEISFYLGCRGIRSPDLIRRDFMKKQPFMSREEFDRLFFLPADYKEYEKYKKEWEKDYQDYKDGAAHYVSALLRGAPNAVHLGYNSVSPLTGQGPGSPALMKKFLEKIGNPENLPALTTEKRVKYWLEAGEEVLGKGLSVGVYYKDYETGEWVWTDGKKTKAIPDYLLEYI